MATKPPTDPGLTGTYWISRDSLAGDLSGMCNLWCQRPDRVRHRYRVTWVCHDHKEPGHIGEYPIESIAGWFGIERVPETDIQLFKVEMGITQRMLDEWQAKSKGQA